MLSKLISFNSLEKYIYSDFALIQDRFYIPILDFYIVNLALHFQ